MALIEYDVYKQKLRDLGPEIDKLSAALDIESARQEAARLALAEGENGVLVFGSLYLASAVRPVMLAETEKNNAAPTV